MARRLVLKNNGLNGTSTPDGYTSIGMNGTTISTQVGATNSGIGGGSSVVVTVTGTKNQALAVDGGTFLSSPTMTAIPVGTIVLVTDPGNTIQGDAITPILRVKNNNNNYSDWVRLVINNIMLPE